MTQLIVDVEDISLLADLKEAILLLRGVGSVTERTDTIDKFNETTLVAIKEARTEEAAGTIDTSSYDAFVNSISKKCGLEEALDDVKAGRVYKAKDVDDLFNQLMK